VTAIVEDALLVVLLSGMIVLAGLRILLRNLPEQHLEQAGLDFGMLWADPALRVMVLWVGMVGAMVATRYDKQISVDAISRLLSDRGKAIARVITDLFAAGVAGVVCWSAVRLILEDMEYGSEVFASVPLWVCELVLPVAFGTIAVRYLAYAVRHAREAAIGGAER
jgi:TRAP-type C4-dicarboxylate transport system permease small subunit